MKKVLVLLSFLVVLNFLSNCQPTEDIIEKETETKVTKSFITLNDLKNNKIVFDKFKKIDDNLNEKISSLKTSRLSFDADYNIFIDTDKIQLIQKDDYKSYTIPVVSIENPNIVENIVITEFNGKTSAYLTSYNLNKTDLNKINYSNTDEIIVFKGDDNQIQSCNTIVDEVDIFIDEQSGEIVGYYVTYANPCTANQAATFIAVDGSSGGGSSSSGNPPNSGSVITSGNFANNSWFNSWWNAQAFNSGNTNNGNGFNIGGSGGATGGPNNGNTNPPLGGVENGGWNQNTIVTNPVFTTSNNTNAEFQVQVGLYLYNLQKNDVGISNLLKNNFYLREQIENYFFFNGGITPENKAAVVFALNNIIPVVNINHNGWSFAEIDQFNYDVFDLFLNKPNLNSQYLVSKIINNQDLSSIFLRELFSVVKQYDYIKPEYDNNNYPGSLENLPYEWWLNTALIPNLSLSPNVNIIQSDLTASEILLVALFPAAALTIKNNVGPAFAMTSVKLPNTGTRNTKADAFRHAFFNAINTRDVPVSISTSGGVALPGSVIVFLFSNAHEATSPPPPPLEVEMDLHNNSVGINYCFNCFPGFSSDDSVANGIMNLLLNGELNYLTPLGPGVMIISGTVIKPTNN